MDRAKLRVAFDLDDTLIIPNSEYTEEIFQYKLLAQIFKVEKLRLGTKEIFHFFEEENCELWIYTTSFRSIRYIKWLFHKVTNTMFKSLSENMWLHFLCY